MDTIKKKGRPIFICEFYNNSSILYLFKILYKISKTQYIYIYLFELIYNFFTILLHTYQLPQLIHLSSLHNHPFVAVEYPINYFHGQIDHSLHNIDYDH